MRGLIEIAMVSSSPEDFEVLSSMEAAFDKKNPTPVVEVLRRNPSLFLRIHGVCMLADIGDDEAVGALLEVLRSDESPLVRHEAAFSLGQLCYRSAVPGLMDAMLKDESVLVRHESAVALGSIGDDSARDALQAALKDPDEDVQRSAEVALRYLDYLAQKSKGPADLKLKLEID